MAATWYLMQFTRDTRAHEPRNVGLILRTESDQWYFHFRGMGDDSKVDGRQIARLGVDRQLYEEWIDYYRRQAQAGSWDTALTLQYRRPSNFSLITGGTLLGDRPDWDSEAFSLFRELVQQPKERGASIVEDALRIFQAAEIQPRREVSVTGRWAAGDEEVGIPFKFGVQDRTLTGIDVAHVSLQDIGWVKQRMDAVARSSTPLSTIAMLPFGEHQDGNASLEALLRSLEQSGHVLDMDDVRAPEQLREALHLV